MEWSFSVFLSVFGQGFSILGAFLIFDFYGKYRAPCFFKCYSGGERALFRPRERVRESCMSYDKPKAFILFG